MTIFDRLTYGTLDRPFIAASIIGGMAAGAMACAGYLNRIGADNTMAAALCAGLAVGTVVSIPLVVVRSWILLKVLPWADRPRLEVRRPDYPELHTLTYQATIPNLGEIDKAMKVYPSPFGDWPIRASLVPQTIDILLRPPYRATYALLEPSLGRPGVDKVQKFLLDKGLGYPTNKTVELHLAGQHALARVKALTHNAPEWQYTR